MNGPVVRLSVGWTGTEFSTSWWATTTFPRTPMRRLFWLIYPMHLQKGVEDLSGGSSRRKAVRSHRLTGLETCHFFNGEICFIHSWCQKRCSDGKADRAHPPAAHGLVCLAIWSRIIPRGITRVGTKDQAPSEAGVTPVKESATP
jgi:hypothetical protein